MDDGDTSDSAEYPSGDETSEYMRQLLKRKRRALRKFERENGSLTKLSMVLPAEPESKAPFQRPSPNPKAPVKRKRASVPAIGKRRRSARQSGLHPKYSELDSEFEEPARKRRKSYSATPRIHLRKTNSIDFDPASVDFNKVHYSSCNKVYSQSGTSCHQCRQKTVDVKSYCRNCSTARGQFCGFCLWKRYGENVVDALQNPKWKCPPCRNICNCSICRRRRGKPPTGPLVPLVSAQGFNSVAEYLQEVGDTIIIDDGDDENLENNFNDEEPVSDEEISDSDATRKETADGDPSPGKAKRNKRKLVSPKTNLPVTVRKDSKTKPSPRQKPAVTEEIRVKEEIISDEDNDSYGEDSSQTPQRKIVVNFPKRSPLQSISASSFTSINLDGQIDPKYQPFVKLEMIDVDG